MATPPNNPSAKTSRPSQTANVDTLSDDDEAPPPELEISVGGGPSQIINIAIMGICIFGMIYVIVGYL